VRGVDPARPAALEQQMNRQSPTLTTLLAGLAIAALALSLPACGSDDSGGGGGSTTTDAGTATDAGPTDAGTAKDTTDGKDAGTAKDAGSAKDAGTAKDAGGSKDTGGTTGSKHNSFGTALPLTVGADPTEETLAPTGELDYFTFEGKKGDAVYIGIAAQTTAFGKEFIDTVITLYDGEKKQIGENDDPTPRNTNDSAILTILPKDGTYYVVVQECWTWVEGKGINASCADPKDKTEAKYSIFVGKLNEALSWVVKDPEKGDKAADAAQIGYNKSTQGNFYNSSRIFGTFKDENDVDYFKFLMPADLDTKDTRLTARFEPHPHGKDGNGSTTSPGTLTVALASAPTEVLVMVDTANAGADLMFPLKGGEEYLFKVKHPGGLAGLNDFYFVSHRPSTDNPLETKDTENNDAKTAEIMPTGQTSGGGTGFFVAGDIKPIKDVDHYAIAVPSGQENDKLTVSCSAMRSGSGLRGFTLTVMKEDGTTLPGAVKFEDAKTDATVSQVPLGGAKKVIVKVNADKQAPDVKSTFYRCGAVIFK